MERLTQAERTPSLTLESVCPNYDPSFHSESAGAVSAVLTFLDSTNAADGKWCALTGVSGVGKTMLARSSHKYLKSRGVESRFMRWITIVDYMRRGDYGVIDHICDAKVLFVDDIGAGYETALSKAKILEIAERRMGKATFWTSNLTLQQIAEQVDVRVASRMVRDGNRVFEFRDCPDWSLANYVP